MFSNWQYRLLALVLAVTCWYIVTGREKVDTWVEVPVEIVGAPENIALREGLPSKIDMRVRGPRALVRGLDPKELGYTLDLSGIEPGKTAFQFSVENMSLPLALEVMEIDPQRTVVTADTLVTKSLPVKVVFDGGPGKDYELVSASSIPSSVVLHGPKPVLDELEEVPVLKREVEPSASGLVSFDADLSLPAGVSAEPADVRVRIAWRARTKEVWIKLPVSVGGENTELVERAYAAPANVQIYAKVPLPILRQEGFRDLFQAMVTLPPSAKAKRRVLPLTVTVPSGVTMSRQVPEKVEVRFKKR